MQQGQDAVDGQDGVQADTRAVLNPAHPVNPVSWSKLLRLLPFLRLFVFGCIHSLTLAATSE
jgi:hypothetical protein